MSFSLKLSHKGILFVSVILLLELLFLGVLTLLLRNARTETKRAEHATATIAQANKVLDAFFDAMSTVPSYVVNRDRAYMSRKIDRAAKALPRELSKLKELSNGDESASKAVEDIEGAVGEGLEIVVDFKAQLERGEKPDLFQILEIERKAKQFVPGVQSGLRNLMALNEKVLMESSSNATEKFQQTVEKLIIIGIALNIAASVLLMLAFTGQITRRLEKLTDNTVRLAKKQELNPPVKGSDEIADLDKFFRQMVDDLEESAAKERQTMLDLTISEERTRSMIDQMPVGLVTVSGKGLISSANPRTESIFGFDDIEIKGKHFSTLFSESAASSPESFLETVEKKAFNRLTEMKAVKANGEVFPVDLSLSSFETDQGDRFLANIFDVSERHEVERLKREFVAMVSHDLRTPLTTIQGSLAIIASGALGNLKEEGKEIITTAEEEVERLRALVNDLLDASKVEAGKIEVNLKEMSLKPVIRRCLETVQPLADKNDISIEAQKCPQLVLGDANRLVQVMINLVGNAVKYSPPGGLIKISFAEKQNWLEVRIEDEGPGIPDQFKDSIFERFEQVKGSESHRKAGTGLGLAISKAIIEEHGGEIGVESSPGCGSTFWFQLKSAGLSTSLSDRV